MTKKPLLYSNQGMILPSEIAVGGLVLNQFNKIEEIFKVKKFDNKVYFNTLEYVDGTEAGFHRFYEMRNNDPNNLVKICQNTFDKQSIRVLN